MPSLSEIGSWISENEALLSGLAAMIVVGGVVLSALGIGYRRLSPGRRPDDSGVEERGRTAASAAGSERSLESSAGEFVEVNAVDHADLSQTNEAIDRVREFCERCAAEDARQRGVS